MLNIADVDSERKLEQPEGAIITKAHDKFSNLPRPLSRNNTKLGEVCPDSIQDHRALWHQQFARPVQYDNTLLLLCNRDKTHVRPCNCLADRLGVGSVVLLPFHIRLHVSRRDQSDFMTKRSNLSTQL